MPKGNFGLAVSIGNVFNDTGCLCKENILPPDGHFEFVFPCTVNLAFSCEVYMKAIMIHFSEADEFRKGHRLHELFDMLNADSQKTLREMFGQELKSDCNILDVFLLEHNKIFENFRYTFQENTDNNTLSVNIDNLVVFANCLKRYCYDLMGGVKNERS